MQMNWTLPGTILEVDLNRPEAADELIGSLFATGGLILSQICQITGLEPYTVQNWVKRGFLTPPEKKKYTCRQFCRVVLINMLKDAMPMESICRLLSYVNGQLDDESDDVIDDSVMYLIFVRLAAACGEEWPPRNLDEALSTVLKEYQAPTEDAARRVKEALKVMLTAWYASQLKKTAMQQLSTLPL